MKRWIIPLTGVGLATLGFGLMAAWAALTHGHTFSGLVQSPPAPVTNFTLTDNTGEPLTLGSLRGQWTLVFYGYTSCPDVCPTTLSNLKQVRQALGDQANRLRIVFISIDPERDTPAVMNKFVQHFGPGFIGLTGAPTQIATAAQAFGVSYNRVDGESPASYMMNHTAYVYLIDPQFRLQVTYPFGIAAKEMAADITYLMAQKQ